MLERGGTLFAAHAVQTVLDCEFPVVDISPSVRTAKPARKPKHQTNLRMRAGILARSSFLNDDELAKDDPNSELPLRLKFTIAVPRADLCRVLLRPAWAFLMCMTVACYRQLSM